LRPLSALGNRSTGKFNILISYLLFFYREHFKKVFVPEGRNFS
jgi:hypothetical protein